MTPEIPLPASKDGLADITIISVMTSKMLLLITLGSIIWMICPAYFVHYLDGLRTKLHYYFSLIGVLTYKL